MKRFPAGSAAATLDRYRADNVLTEIEVISRPCRAELSLKSATDLLLSSVRHQHQNQGWVRLWIFISRMKEWHRFMVNICALTTVAHRRRGTEICLFQRNSLSVSGRWGILFVSFYGDIICDPPSLMLNNFISFMQKYKCAKLSL